MHLSRPLDPIHKAYYCHNITPNILASFKYTYILASISNILAILFIIVEIAENNPNAT